MTEVAREALEAVSKTVEQVKKQTGMMYHFNLDDLSFKSLQDASSKHKALGTPVSLSVVARRAFRLYNTYMNKIDSDEAKMSEGYQLLRAAKGT